MKLRTILVEDSANVLEILQHFLGKYCPELQIVDTANTLDKAEQQIRQHKPDLVFFDIVMGGGTSFDLLERLEQENEIHFLIIFVTAHPRFDFAEKAIDHSAVGYLTKPIDKEKLVRTVRKALSLYPLHSFKEITSTLDRLGNSTDPMKKLLKIFKAKQVIQPVKAEEVSHILAERETSRVVLTNGDEIPSTRPLAFYQDDLTDHPAFFRIHNSTLLNIHEVQEFNHRDNLLILKSGIRLNCSRRMGKALYRFFAGKG
jgi:two-component system, LytTR family, response regulator